MARWSITPREFWALDEDSRAFMIQFLITEGQIASYESYLAEKKSKKSSK